MEWKTDTLQFIMLFNVVMNSMGEKYRGSEHIWHIADLVWGLGRPL